MVTEANGTSCPEFVPPPADCVRAEHPVVEAIRTHKRKGRSDRLPGRPKDPFSMASLRAWREGDDVTPYLAPPDAVGACLPLMDDPAYVLSKGKWIWKRARDGYNRIVKIKRAQIEGREIAAASADAWDDLLGPATDSLKALGAPDHFVAFQLAWWKRALSCTSGKSSDLLAIKKDIESTMESFVRANEKPAEKKKNFRGVD